MQTSNSSRDSGPLAVVIPYYRGSAFIEPCITSLLKSSSTPEYICIVDNDPDRIQQDSWLYNNNLIDIVRVRTGIGFGRACNIGVQRAKSKGCQLFVILNQDTVLERNCISALLDAYGAHGGLRMISAIPTEYGSSTISAHFRRHILSHIEQYVQDEIVGTMSDTYIASRMFAVCFLFDLHLLNTVGLFDPVFEMYGEDDDLALRVQSHHGSIILCTSAFAQHRHMLEHGATPGVVRRQQMQSRLILRIRYQGLNRLQFSLHCIKLFGRALVMSESKSLSPGLYLQTMRSHLKRWHQIKLRSPEHIRTRIERQIELDQ